MLEDDGSPQALVLEAGRNLEEGEILYMDYGAGRGTAGEDKLDAQILLDYGAYDPGSNQARMALSEAPTCAVDPILGCRLAAFLPAY